VNYLSHYYLTLLLLDKLDAGGGSGAPGRVVQVSSVTHGGALTHHAVSALVDQSRAASCHPVHHPALLFVEALLAQDEPGSTALAFRTWKTIILV
jgi:NAD(P)-dependent dehydrogenase (short-subunit alcohol dehydrogenase family)